MTFPLLSDEKLATIRAWGVEDKENGTAWPAIYVIDRGGRVAWRSVAETYKVRAGPALIIQALEQLGR